MKEIPLLLKEKKLVGKETNGVGKAGRTEKGAKNGQREQAWLWKPIKLINSSLEKAAFPAVL